MIVYKQCNSNAENSGWQSKHEVFDEALKIDAKIESRLKNFKQHSRFAYRLPIKFTQYLHIYAYRVYRAISAQ